MNLMRPQPRGRLDYIAATLRAAADGKTKTQIMYAAFLSYAQANILLRYLVNKKLIRHEKVTGRYYQTRRGTMALRYYDAIADQTGIAQIMDMPPGAIRELPPVENKQIRR
jgi:predicted transcriptional regulator